MLATLELEPGEISWVNAVLAELCARFEIPESESFLDAAVGLGEDLPGRLRNALMEIRARTAAPALLVRGFPFADSDAGPTPTNWRTRSPRATIAQDFLLLLLASRIGRVFGWRTLQDGRLLNDIHPIPGREQEQTGHSSEAALDLHVEDAFHSERCDFLALLCVRNRHHIATTLSSVWSDVLPKSLSRILREPRYLVRADSEHLRHLEYGGSGLAEYAEKSISVLFGDVDSPFLRIDPPYMSVAAEDVEAGSALAALVDRLNAQVIDVILKPGDILFIDNYRCVHGRRPFVAAHDGTDRWLRRAFVADVLTGSEVGVERKFT